MQAQEDKNNERGEQIKEGERERIGNVFIYIY